MPVRHEPVRSVRVGARTVTLLPGIPYDVDYVPATGIVGFAFDAQSGTHAFADERDRPFRARPNTPSWLPPGCGVRSRSARGGEYLTVAPPSRAAPPRHGMRRWSDRPCPEAARAARALRTVLLRGDGASARPRPRPARRERCLCGGRRARLRLRVAFAPDGDDATPAGRGAGSAAVTHPRGFTRSRMSSDPRVDPPADRSRCRSRR